MNDKKTPSYWDYLKLDGLLSLQGGLTDDEADVSPDELHFIIVHQCYELWFKGVLAELRAARDILLVDPVPESDIPRVVAHFDRVIAIIRLAVDQFRVMETLSPQGFLAFRDKLVPASGFQSFQMRELEILLGLKVEEREEYESAHALEHLERTAKRSESSARAWARIEATAAEPSLLVALSQWLYRTPIRGSTPGKPDDEQVVASFVSDYLAAADAEAGRFLARMGEIPGRDTEPVRAGQAASAESNRAFLAAEDLPKEERPRARRIRAGVLFIESYRELPLLAWPRTLLDKVAETEEELVIWRHRHARMVERTIGRRVGTGGSSGVDYLDRTTAHRIFTDLWAVRTLLLRSEAVPPLPDEGTYRFAAEENENE